MICAKSKQGISRSYASYETRDHHWPEFCPLLWVDDRSHSRTCARGGHKTSQPRIRPRHLCTVQYSTVQCRPVLYGNSHCWRNQREGWCRRRRRARVPFRHARAMHPRSLNGAGAQRQTRTYTAAGQREAQRRKDEKTKRQKGKARPDPSIVRRPSSTVYRLSSTVCGITPQARLGRLGRS